MEATSIDADEQRGRRAERAGDDAPGARGPVASRAGRVLVTVGSVGAAVLLVALIAGVVLGLRPLERRAAAIIAPGGAPGGAPGAASGAAAGASTTGTGAHGGGAVGEILVVWPRLERPRAAGATAAGAGAERAAATAERPQLPPGIVDTSGRVGVAREEPDRTWLAEQFQREILETARAAAASAPDPLSNEALARVARALGASGWFHGEPGVRRELGGRVVVEGTWRIPAAVVRVGGRDRVIDWSARPMPPEYGAGRSGLWVIEGVAEGPVRDAAGAIDFAQPWPGEDVAGAVELLMLAGRQPWAGQVAGVEIATYTDTKRLALMTREGTRVVWGGRPSRPLLGESTTAAKLDKVNMLFRDFGRIDAGKPAVEVFWEGKPLVLDLSASAQEAQRREAGGSGEQEPGATPEAATPARPSAPARAPGGPSREPRGARTPGR